MKFCVILEVAAPCRMPHYEKHGPSRRLLILWFSLIFLPMSWTEFLKRYGAASVEHYLEQHGITARTDLGDN